MRNDLSAVKEMLTQKAVEAEAEQAVSVEVDDSEIEKVKEVLEGVAGEEVETEEESEEETEEVEEESGEAEVVSGEYTMKSLAEAIELDQQELYNVKVPLRDGQEPITIGEMKNKFQDLITEKTKSDAKIQELEQNITRGTPQQQLSQAEFTANVEMSKIQEEYGKTDWADLDEFDPGKSALLRQQFNDRYNQAQNVLYQAGQQRQADHQTFLGEQNAELLKIIPTWSDATVRTADEAKIGDIMRNAGYSDDIIKGNTDPISLKLLHELMTLRAEKTHSNEMVKKVKKAPKALSGTKVAPENKQSVTQKLVKKAKQTRNKHDEFAAVKAMFQSS